MTNPGPLSHDARLRDDLTVVEIDGDLIVFDPIRMESHVLSGGAVAVWMELEGQTSEGLTVRVAERVGREVDALADDVTAVVEQFRSMGLVKDPAHPIADAENRQNRPLAGRGRRG